MTSAPTFALDARFARELPELALPWQAAATPEPRVLVLNEPLAGELGLDAAWLRWSCTSITPSDAGLTRVSSRK